MRDPGKDFELLDADGGRASVLSVRVQPGASRTRVVGPWNGRVKITVAAPAEKGRANQVLLEFLAELCALRVSALTLVSGHLARDKRVHIQLPAERVRAALLRALR